MSKVIAVNSGSSSLKFQVFDMPSETVLTSGQAERIGQEKGAFTIKVNGEKKTQELPIADHQVAVDLMLKELVENAHQRGIKILLDAVFNHCSYLCKQFQDVLLKGNKRIIYTDYIKIMKKTEGSFTDSPFFCAI